MSIRMIVVWWLKSFGMTVLNVLDNISPDIIYAGNRFSFKLPSISIAGTLVSNLRPSQLHVLVCTGSLVESSFEKEKDIILGNKSTEDENDLASKDDTI